MARSNSGGAHNSRGADMVINARALLAAVLLVLVPLAARATAEAPVLGRLVDSGQLGRPTRHAHARLKPFLHRGGVGSLARAKEGAALFAPTPSARSRARVSSTVVAGFDGIDEVSTLAQPPDGAIAVSSSYIVEAVNSAVSVWTKTYDATGQLSAVTRAIDAASLDVLFGNNPGCYTGANDFFGLVSDPSADYDVAHDRFMLSVISFDQLFFTSSVCIAVTETGNPTGNWFIYAFPVSPFTSLLDFPRAVVGADGQIYLAGNLFLCCDALGEPIFDHARVYAFTATDMYVGGNATARFVVVGNDPERRAEPHGPLVRQHGLGGPQHRLYPGGDAGRVRAVVPAREPRWRPGAAPAGDRGRRPSRSVPLFPERRRRWERKRRARLRPLVRVGLRRDSLHADRVGHARTRGHAQGRRGDPRGIALRGLRRHGARPPRQSHDLARGAVRQGFPGRRDRLGHLDQRRPDHGYADATG